MLTYHVITFGCQMNKSDSERLEAVFKVLGLNKIDDCVKADVVIMNTCSVRQTAENRIYGYMGVFSKIKKQRKFYVGIIGCMAGRDHDGKIRKTFAEVDFFGPTNQMLQMAQEIADFFGIKKEVVTTEEYLDIMPAYTYEFEAFVPIMNGCNMKCAYCVVPQARGGEVSRDLKKVLDEVKGLVENGCKEICLLGQNVNSYKPRDVELFSLDNPYEHGFAKLLWEIDKIIYDTNIPPLSGAQRMNTNVTNVEQIGIKKLPILSRVYFTSPHPMNFYDDVIEAMGLPSMMPYAHIPIQSGSNNILKAMRRPYTVEKYLEIIEKLKIKVPNITLATDIIVGFPGETEEDFMQTVEIYKKIQFDISYTAQYSPRTGTTAYVMKDDVPKEEKKRRWEYLQDMMEKMTLEKNQQLVGTVSRVLITEQDGEYMVGHDQHMKKVWVEISRKAKVKSRKLETENTVFSSQHTVENNNSKLEDRSLKIGDMVDVVIDKGEMWRLWGKQSYKVLSSPRLYGGARLVLSTGAKG